jgi:hypothetical protein
MVPRVAKIANRLEREQNTASLFATASGAKPGDFRVGSVQSRAAARVLISNYAAEQSQDESAEFANLTPYEIAVAEGEDAEIVPMLIRLARTVEERAKLFGFSLETSDEIRHLKRVAKLANEMTDGQYGQISLADPAEGKRIRDLAKEELKVQMRSPLTEPDTT